MSRTGQTNRSIDDKGGNRSDFQLGYKPALDGLRGISILAVMAFNGHFLWLQGGFVGVDIFFVLSGFLITALLVQEFRRTAGIGLKNFYFRRALRLLPALFALMLFCIAYALLLQPADKAAVTLKGVLYTFFYVANWSQIPPFPPGIGALSHAWSLSVEEQFYIIFPLLLLVLLKLKSKRIVLAILCSLVTISMLLNVWFWHAGTPFLRMYFGTDTRANELLIGCLAALILLWGTLQPSNRLKWAFHFVSLISLVGILISFFLVRHFDPFVYNGGFTLISIGTAVLILDLLVFPSILSRCFEFAPLVWIGKISYGLYLWHFPIFQATQKLFEGKTSPIFYEVTGVVVTLVVATISYYFLEQPFLKLRRRDSDNEAKPDLSTVPTPTAESI